MKTTPESNTWDRRTTIIATLGPATSAPEKIRQLLEAGVDVVRLNFSHGTSEEHKRSFEAVRNAEREIGRPVAIMQDLMGPKIRVGRLPGGPMDLREGQRLTIAADKTRGAAGTITTSYPDLARVLRKGDHILLDDGRLELIVEGKSRGEVSTRVARGGMLKEHKGINLPGVALKVPVLTEKDQEDLALGVRLGVDYVALSFVRRGRDIAAGRRALARHRARTPIIAKLEKAEAIDALDEIVREADGVMVARGDLGVELPPESVPILQKTIIRKANAAGIPVITATQMLESMTGHPRPTRAETSDVANAILDGTDAVMLSGETAIGAYPLEAVTMMNRIARAVESSNPGIFAQATTQHGMAVSVARAAGTLAQELTARAIVVITRTGRSAELLSKHRPHAPLIAFTEIAATARRLALWWGIRCYVTPFADSTDAMIAHVESELISRRFARAGDTIVLVGSAPLIMRGRTNFVKVHRVRSRG